MFWGCVLKGKIAFEGALKTSILNTAWQLRPSAHSRGRSQSFSVGQRASEQYVLLTLAFFLDVHIRYFRQMVGCPSIYSHFSNALFRERERERPPFQKFC